MSLIANRTFVSSLQEKLSDTMPLSMLKTTLDAVSELLAGYDIEQIPTCAAGDNDFMLDAYINAMRSEGLSDKTLNRYRYILSRALKAFQVPTQGVTNYHIRKYFSDEMERGIKDTTVRGYYWCFSAYFGWLHRDGLIQRNPMSNIGKIKCQKKVKEVFSEVDIEKLKQACDNPRDLAIVCFLKSTCCRISEVTQLNRDDVDFIHNQCIVLGKGNKQRTVYIGSVTAMILKAYLDSRTDDSEALFYGKRADHRLQPNGVRVMLHKLEKKTGVHHVHPHKFRRTEITELVNRGMPIEQVKTLAGHEKLDTTMGYVVIDQNNVKNNYMKFA